jgi:hypothetical protein
MADFEKLKYVGGPSFKPELQSKVIISKKTFFRKNVRKCL